MKTSVWSETKGRSFVSAEATVVFNSKRGGYELHWTKKGKLFHIDLDFVLAERDRLAKDKKKAEEAKLGSQMRALVAKPAK